MMGTEPSFSPLVLLLEGVCYFRRTVCGKRGEGTDPSDRHIHTERPRHAPAHLVQEVVVVVVWMESEKEPRNKRRKEERGGGGVREWWDDEERT